MEYVETTKTVKQRLSELLKVLQDKNPGRVFEMTWHNDPALPGGCIELVEAGQRLWCYSTTVFNGDIVVNDRLVQI